MHRVELTPIFVLHTQPFRNTSLLADLFSPNQGRIKVVARSARGPSSRFRGYLQPFHPLLASWTGRGDLKTLTHLELHRAPVRLNPRALSCGFYLNELLFHLLPREDPHPDIFDGYQKTLELLAEKDWSEWYLRLFEKQLLQILGYALPLSCDVETLDPIEADYFYRLVLQRGFVRCDADEQSPWVFKGLSLLDLEREVPSEAHVLQDAKRLMRLVLMHYLNRPIRSREWA